MEMIHVNPWHASLPAIECCIRNCSIVHLFEGCDYTYQRAGLGTLRCVPCGPACSSISQSYTWSMVGCWAYVCCHRLTRLWYSCSLLRIDGHLWKSQLTCTFRHGQSSTLTEPQTYAYECADSRAAVGDADKLSGCRKRAATCCVLLVFVWLDCKEDSYKSKTAKSYFSVSLLSQFQQVLARPSS